MLTAGGFSLCVWKEGTATPLLRATVYGAQITAGTWSHSRPGVFYVAKEDGTLDAWDVLDRSSRVRIPRAEFVQLQRPRHDAERQQPGCHHHAGAVRGAGRCIRARVALDSEPAQSTLLRVATWRARCAWSSCRSV